MKHLFVIHTPFQLFTAAQIAPTLDGEVIFCIEGSADNYDQLPDNVSIHWLAKHTQFRFSRTAYCDIESGAGLIRELVGNSPNRIYLSDLHWFMNNRIFFDQVLKKRCSFTLFDEGVGLYHGEQSDFKQMAKDSVKSLLGKTGYFPPVKATYKGHIFGYDHPRIEAIYALEPAWLSINKPVIAIPRPMLNHQPDATKWLFLDQPFWQRGESAHQKLLDETISTLRHLCDGEMIVKLHHAARPNDKLRYEEAGFKILNSNMTAELAIAEYGFGHLISYVSSALLNSRLLYPNLDIRSIHAHRLRDLALIKPSVHDDIIALFDKADIPHDSPR